MSNFHPDANFNCPYLKIGLCDLLECTYIVDKMNLNTCRYDSTSIPILSVSSLVSLYHLQLIAAACMQPIMFSNVNQTLSKCI